MVPPVCATPLSLISTKLVPPRQAGQVVARERLLARMLAARRTRCMVLNGGAGAGKTSLLNAYQLALAPLGFDVAWLSLSPDDDEPAQFLDYLIASLGTVQASLVHEAQLLTGVALDPETSERLMVALIHAIAGHGKELVLVIDDVHLLSEAVLRTCALQFLLDHAPANLHLVLAARHAVPLALGRLQAEGQVFALGPQDLRFTPEETEAFLRHLHGVVDARDAARLQRLSDGWPAGLQLLAMHLRRGDAPHELAPIHDADSFADYFEREVLSRLSTTEVDQLTRLSIAARFGMRLAGMLLATEDGQAASVDASRLIARIERENLFIVPLDSADRERWYRLHPLLRGVLLRRLQAWPQAQLQGLHRRAADWFEAQGLIDEAVQHRLDAGEEEAAASLLEACADLLQLREYRGMARLLRRLPPEVVQRRTRLRLLDIGLLLRMRQYPACEQALDALDRELPPSAQLARAQMDLARAALALKRDDTASAHAVLQALGPLPPDADAWMVGSQKNLMSVILLHAGEFEAARRVQDEGPPRLLLGQPLLAGTQGILAGRCLAGLSHAQQGQITQAEQIYREVLQAAPTVDADCRDAVFLATALLGEVLYERGEAAAAIALLEPQLDLLERFSLPDTVLRGLLTLARAHRLLGHHLECLSCLERLDDHAQAHGLDRLRAAALMEQALDLLRTLQFAQADGLIARLDALAARHAQHGGSLAEVAHIATATHIRRALAHGELSQAERLLAGFTAQCAARGNWQRVARMKLLQAVLARASHQADDTHAQEALRLGHRLGLVRSLLDAHPDAALIVQSVQAQGLDPVLHFYADRLLAAHRRSHAEAPASPPAPGLDEALTQREADVLQQLLLALPNKRIARALGLSIETVKWHLRNVYRKLDVAGRDDAVTRARDLGLACATAAPALEKTPPPSLRGG